MRTMTELDPAFDDADLLDPEAREVPERLTRDELMAASDFGWRRHGWRFDDPEDDR